jgi:hypothetical protein
MLAKILEEKIVVLEAVNNSDFGYFNLILW